ncbi:MAG: protein translocase subunit SecF [Oscillospiraceae bacterium]
MKLKYYDFVGKRKIYFAISLVLISIVFLVSFVFGVELDVAFKGGSIITYNYSGTVNFDEFENFVENTIGEKVQINKKNGIAGGSDSLDIVLASTEGLNADKQIVLSKAIKDKYGAQLDFLSNSSVDPAIGKEFFAKGMVAIAFASIILVIYIAFRFKKINGLSAGITAVIALIHDVILVFGTFAIFRIPLDDNFIAVVLTILGFSINDTIVIYDRIRENKRLHGKSLSVEKLVNNSINETMTRTLGTSGAVLGTLIIVCIVAVLMNVSSIVSFAFPMLIGTISGTYSTIFIAGPLWVMWQNFKEKKAKQKNTAHAHAK